MEHTQVLFELKKSPSTLFVVDAVDGAFPSLCGFGV